MFKPSDESSRAQLPRSVVCRVPFLVFLPGAVTCKDEKADASSEDPQGSTGAPNSPRAPLLSFLPGEVAGKLLEGFEDMETGPQNKSEEGLSGSPVAWLEPPCFSSGLCASRLRGEFVSSTCSEFAWSAMAVHRSAPQLVPLLSVAVAGRQAATHLLTRRRASCNGSGLHAVATAFAGTSLHWAWRYGTTAAAGKHPRSYPGSVRRAGTAVERHLTRLPGTRQAEDLRTPPSLSQPVLELRQSFRCAPPGLVQALADALGLPRQADLLALALGEDAEAVLTAMAKQRAEAGQLPSHRPGLKTCLGPSPGDRFWRP